MPLLTGTVKFSTGIEELNMYGYGDREYNIRYSVVNFNASTKLISGFQMNRIGTWSSEGDELSFYLCLREIWIYMYVYLGTSIHVSILKTHSCLQISNLDDRWLSDLQR
jgi:hypothetical protein